MVPSLYVVRSHGAVHSHAMLTNFRQHRFNLITMLPQDPYILYTKLVSVVKWIYDKLFFSNVSTILHISAVFPVTSCECERSISTLRLLKTYLRSTMGQDKLIWPYDVHFVLPQRHIREHTQDSYRFCKEATKKDYSTRHSNWIIKLATCMFVYYVTIIFHIFIMFIYVSNY